MPWATVFKNVLLPLKLRDVDPDEAAARVREAIEMVGLDGFEQRLSAGAVGRHEDARVDRPRAGDRTRGCF